MPEFLTLDQAPVTTGPADRRLVSAPSGMWPMSDDAPVCEIHTDDNDDVFVVVGGVKIAKRGLPGTPHAGTWIMLQPGWMVHDVKGGKAIEVRYEHPGRMH
jgi:hypothetical protein